MMKAGHFKNPEVDLHRLEQKTKAGRLRVEVMD
jgi:hypothetical protein